MHECMCACEVCGCVHVCMCSVWMYNVWMCKCACEVCGCVSVHVKCVDVKCVDCSVCI